VQNRALLKVWALHNIRGGIPQWSATLLGPDGRPLFALSVPQKTPEKTFERASVALSYLRGGPVVFEQLPAVGQILVFDQYLHLWRQS
jgi:hypothetical protein